MFKIELRQNCSGRESWRRSKKNILFIARTTEPLGPGGGGAIVPPPYCGRNRSKTISFKRCWITTCLLPPLDFQTFHRPWKKLVKKGLRPPRLRSGSEISSSRNIVRTNTMAHFFLTHWHYTLCVCRHQDQLQQNGVKSFLILVSLLFLWGSLVIRFGNWRNFTWKGKYLDNSQALVPEEQFYRNFGLDDFWFYQSLNKQ